MKAYIAGPLFDDGERWWMERVDQVVGDAGFTTFLPHRDNPQKTEHNVAEIFANDRGAVEDCDVVVVSLNGIITDDGTAWELGYAYALGKPIVGLHTDWRRRFEHEVVNLMIECSLTSLVHSLDDVADELRKLFPD